MTPLEKERLESPQLGLGHTDEELLAIIRPILENLMPTKLEVLGATMIALRGKANPSQVLKVIEVLAPQMRER